MWIEGVQHPQRLSSGLHPQLPESKLRALDGAGVRVPESHALDDEQLDHAIDGVRVALLEREEPLLELVRADDLDHTVSMCLSRYVVKRIKKQLWASDRSQ
jgi:hypothetical protein